MAWVESHQEIGTHPKTKKAARLAGVSVPTMVGHLHLVWHWALDFAQEVDISAIDPWILEDAALWGGAEGVLYEALQGAGFIDHDGETRTLHDWYEYAGKLIEQRKADRERKRRKSGGNPEPQPGIPTDIRQNGDGGPKEFQGNSGGTPTEGGRNPGVTLTVTVPKPYQESNGEPSVPAASGERQEPPIDPSDGDVYALVDAWAAATDRKPSQLQGRARLDAFRALQPLVKSVTKHDIGGCVGWLKSDPFWTPDKLTIAKLADVLPQWIAMGRPARQPPRTPPRLPRRPASIGMTNDELDALIASGDAR
jgi:hypothetical protein